MVELSGKDKVPSPIWKIYYDDGSTFDSNDGEWDEAPLDGVIFVVEKVGDRTVFHSGNDYYVMMADTVMTTGDLGPILRKLGFVKFGRWTSHRTFERISQRVREEWK